MKRILTLFKSGRTPVMLVVVAALIAFVVMPVLADDEPAYVTLEDETFAGRCNLRFYEHDGDKVARNESIRYMAVYVVAQADDEPSLLMSGEWGDPPVVPYGALVMAWKSVYGPYEDKEAYQAGNVSECTVPPDYFWVTWGAQGDYTSRGFLGRRLTQPYLTLDGLGVGIDWDESESDILSFGEVSLRGRMQLGGNVTDPELRKYSATVLVQSVQVDTGNITAPHWALQGKVKLPYLEDGDVCWACILGDNEEICEWIYNYFGVNLCPEYEPPL